MRKITSIPNASRTFDALRSLGYDLNASVADIVDNAITEKVAARNVDVTFTFRSGGVCCRIMDDGCGMSESELEECMRLGASTSYESEDLGKFGMGMKTASLSHCNVLTVISKKKRSGLCGYRWDISHIRANGWVLLKLEQQDIEKILLKEKINLGNHGTLIMWDDLFLINQEFRSYANDKLAQNYYFRLEEQLKLHLRMVYHRFFDGSLGKRGSVRIRVNNELLSPWDPFCRTEARTEHIPFKKSDAKLMIPGYKAPILIDGYIVPTREGFSSEEAWKQGRGPMSWNDSQGYYIYRANRMIRFGGWHGTKAKDEHDKLARISIDIDPAMDEIFRITVNKTKVQFPELLFQHLKNVINPQVIRKAKLKYKKSVEHLVVNNTLRKNIQDIDSISRKLVNEHGISTKSLNNMTDQQVEVVNPSGSWMSNAVGEFLQYGGDKDYEIVSGHLDNDQLWKIVCNEDAKFKVIVNASHPFYTTIYKTSANKAATNALDAMIFSLAFAELYNRNDMNARMFDSFKKVCSRALERLTKEKVF